MRVRWTRPALADIAEIHDYIAAENPFAANSVVRRIRQEAGSLDEHPMIGRPGRVSGTRELVLRQLPYVLAYRNGKDAVDILAVIHTSRRWPDRLPG